MAINFNELPSNKPQSTLPVGYYQATIIRAEMKTSKTSGNPYLSLQYDLNDGNGHTGKLFDLQMESEKEFLRYKLQRFLNAMQLNLTGPFELKDLCKLINGKRFVVDVGVEDSERGKRNTVNSFEHDIYYPINEWASLTGAVAQEPAEVMSADELPFTINAADALDSEEY